MGSLLETATTHNLSPIDHFSFCPLWPAVDPGVLLPLLLCVATEADTYAFRMFIYRIFRTIRLTFPSKLGREMGVRLTV